MQRGFTGLTMSASGPVKTSTAHLSNFLILMRARMSYSLRNMCRTRVSLLELVSSLRLSAICVKSKANSSRNDESLLSGQTSTCAMLIRCLPSSTPLREVLTAMTCMLQSFTTCSRLSQRTKSSSSSTNLTKMAMDSSATARSVIALCHERATMRCSSIREVDFTVLSLIPKDTSKAALASFSKDSFVAS